MTYDVAKLKVDRVSGAALLGWTAVLGEMRLGLAEGVHETVPVSSLSLADGYTVEDSGALSLDPATGTASYSSRVNGAPSAVAALHVNDKVEISYNDVIIFVGAVTAVSCSLESSTDEGTDYLRRISYTLASLETVLLSAVVEWDSLPEESALTRLRRWFTVDVSEVATSHLSWANALVPAETDPGSASMIDLARAFTTATLLPLRMTTFFTPAWNSLAAFDTSTDWDDQPLTVSPGLDSAEDWATSADFESHGTALVPTGISVKSNDMRLTGGQTTESITPALLGSTFRLDVSRLGSSGVIAVGFRAPGVIDAFGTPVAVSRVSQTFGPTSYSADLEIAPPLSLPAERTS